MSSNLESHALLPAALSKASLRSEPKRSAGRVARGLDHDDRGHGLEPLSLK